MHASVVTSADTRRCVVSIVMWFIFCSAQRVALGQSRLVDIVCVFFFISAICEVPRNARQSPTSSIRRCQKRKAGPNFLVINVWAWTVHRCHRGTSGIKRGDGRFSPLTRFPGGQWTASQMLLMTPTVPCLQNPYTAVQFLIVGRHPLIILDTKTNSLTDSVHFQLFFKHASLSILSHSFSPFLHCFIPG